MVLLRLVKGLRDDLKAQEDDLRVQEEEFLTVEQRQARLKNRLRLIDARATSLARQDARKFENSVEE